jgi:kynureninase
MTEQPVPTPHPLDDLAALRAEFPILATCTYLISNSLGAMPHGVYEALRRYADTWATLGVRAWGTPYEADPTWWALKGAVGDRIAPLIGAPPGTVLMQENASIANAAIVGALDFSDTRRDKIVISDQDFPSDVYSVTRMLPPHVRAHMVHSRDGITLDTDELLAAIDERTRLVSLSHVLFRSAYIVPAAAIVAKAHAVGAQVLLNGYHSVGVIPVDVTALGVDFYVGGTLKWMCGGPGGVFAYVRPDLLTALQPRMTGWMAHTHPFAFDVAHYEPREDQYRLANGTPGIASLYAVQPGVEVMHRVGVERIRARSLVHTERVIARADAAGYTVVTPRDPAVRGGTVTVHLPEAYAVSRALIAAGYIVDYREGAGIRIAPHFYNTDDEVDGVMDALTAIVREEAWRPYAQERAYVT